MAEDFDTLKRLLLSLGDPDQAFSRVMDARGENPGSVVDPRLQGMDSTKLALLDRMGSGRQARATLGLPLAALGGVVGMAPYEGLKWGAQNVPGADKLLKLMGGLTGDPKAASNYSMDGTTSPASLRNVMAYFSGLGMTQ